MMCADVSWAGSREAEIWKQRVVRGEWGVNQGRKSLFVVRGRRIRLYAWDVVVGRRKMCGDGGRSGRWRLLGGAACGAIVEESGQGGGGVGEEKKGRVRKRVEGVDKAKGLWNLS